ncbi:transposase domain protein [Leptospira interrogans str. 2006001854]|uniref:Transposase domain protein n=1 Tax=Leptospira interrogans str. 2006001854 TaxID=1001590 RepID=M6GGR6_LEPIR|nr:transposase domain protein [Leptospira interrogans str. 2006001854]
MNRSIGSQSFRIAKSILNKGVQVIVLNPGNLATIYQSLKKTDKEDSLKIARLIQRHPIEELPTVPIPNDEEEDNRRLCSEHENWTKQLTQGKNRLHSLFTQAGLTQITKKHLRTKVSREASVTLLSDRYQKEAERILKVLDLVELNLKLIEEEIQEALQKKQSLCSDDHVYAWNWNDYFFGDQSKLNISPPYGSFDKLHG